MKKLVLFVKGLPRGVLNKEGKRWDLLFMGILKDEWIARYQPDLLEGRAT